MQRDKVDDGLRELAFDFFFWFSRFESALKEARYLDPDEVGARARPNWTQFVRDHRLAYEPNAAALALLEANPQRQVVGVAELEFEEISFAPEVRQLDRVVTLAKTVRNNLFHGGKHGSTYWDNPTRMRELLTITVAVLDDLARLGNLEAHYTGYY